MKTYGENGGVGLLILDDAVPLLEDELGAGIAGIGDLLCGELGHCLLVELGLEVLKSLGEACMA
jgi:hypothetical protein